jgi:hypothetical protein
MKERARERLTRETIIETLTSSLKPLHYIHAFWEAGAISWNRVDEWSDIDLYIAVNDDKVEDTFQAVERALKSLSPIKQKYDVPETGFPGVSQAFYKLENTSEYLIIDLAVLKLSAPDMFLEPEMHGNPLFHFNKSSCIKVPSLDKETFNKKLGARMAKLQARIDMFNNFVQKEINRRNFLEAIEMYYNITLASLVEALRMKHYPIHYEFRMRYVHYEFPQKVISRLQTLYLVKDFDDLREKYREATIWFHETMFGVRKQN